jgi:hypothetical protein
VVATVVASSVISRCCLRRYTSVVSATALSSSLLLSVVMNVESLDSNRKARTVGSKGRKDPKSSKCFYCDILGHVKAGCPVRIYRLERSEKKRTGKERHGDEKDEENMSGDLGNGSTRRRLLCTLPSNLQWEE